MKAVLKNFFRNAYQILLGKEKGPRLPTLIWAADKEKLQKLTEFSNDPKHPE